MLYPLSRSQLATDIVLPILATAAVVLRFVARRTRKIPLLADDWLIFVALILALGISANGIYAASTDIFGKPFQDLTPPQFVEHGKLLWADVLMCHLTYGIIKISVALFYRRIFITPWFRLASSILIVADVCWLLPAIFGHIFSAWPVQNWWLYYRTVIDYEVYLVTMATFDIVLDIITLCLPLPVIRHLQMTTKRKLLLVGVFALGWFCIVASAIRLYYTEQLLLANRGELPPSALTGANTWNDIWAHIEACISIVTACLPAIAPLFKGKLSASSLAGSFSRLSGSSWFTLKRYKSTNDNQSPMNSETHRAWYELHANQQETTATAKSASQVRLAPEMENKSGIVVDRSFASQFEQV